MWNEFYRRGDFIKSKIVEFLDHPYWVFIGFSFLMLIFGFALASPVEIFEGLVAIVYSPDILLTDYIEVGGLGATFVNSGLVMLISVGILIVFKHKPSRYTVTTLMLASGFAFFGKNPVNITPILLGGFLFSIYAKEPFSKNVLATLLGTTLSPVVSQMTFIEYPGDYSSILGLLSALVIGVAIGFIIEPLAKNSIKAHEGYNLYNAGFAAGILGLIIMSVFRNFGFDFRPVNILSSGNDTIIIAFTLCMSAYFLGVGFLLSGGNVRKCYSLLLEINEKGSYFSKIHGVEYLKMGVIGAFVILFVMVIGVDLNGPIIGAIFTIVGFSCSGKKITNIIPVMIGAGTAGYLNIYDHDSTAVVMAILFSTCLSPIAEKFGFFWGVVAGFLHMAVSLNIGIVNGGLNLYNNGLAGGFVVMTLVPLIRAFSKKQRRIPEADSTK